MDIYCQKCGEPYDAFGIKQLMDEEAEDGYRLFIRGVGCPCCHWGRSVENDQSGSTRSIAMAAVAALLEDDPDGMASMLDDFEYMGWLQDEE